MWPQMSPAVYLQIYKALDQHFNVWSIGGPYFSAARVQGERIRLPGASSFTFDVKLLNSFNHPFLLNTLPKVSFQSCIFSGYIFDSNDLITFSCLTEYKYRYASETCV